MKILGCSLFILLFVSKSLLFADGGDVPMRDLSAAERAFYTKVQSAFLAALKPLAESETSQFAIANDGVFEIPEQLYVTAYNPDRLSYNMSLDVKDGSTMQAEALQMQMDAAAEMTAKPGDMNAMADIGRKLELKSQKFNIDILIAANETEQNIDAYFPWPAVQIAGKRKIYKADVSKITAGTVKNAGETLKPEALVLLGAWENIKTEKSGQYRNVLHASHQSKNTRQAVLENLMVRITSDSANIDWVLNTIDWKALEDLFSQK